MVVATISTAAITVTMVTTIPVVAATTATVVTAVAAARKVAAQTRRRHPHRVAAEVALAVPAEDEAEGGKPTRRALKIAFAWKAIPSEARVTRDEVSGDTEWKDLPGRQHHDRD